MKPLVNAFEVLLSSAVQSGGDLAKTASFTLDNVDWSAEPNQLEVASQPVVDTCLRAACVLAGPSGSRSHTLAERLLAVADRLKWRARPKEQQDDPDLSAFAQNFSATTVIGDGGLLPSDKVSAGFSLQGGNTYYPPHAHTAEESYWIIGGRGEWKVDDDPWFTVEPGCSVYHKSGALHAMKTADHPLLSVWLWTSHLNSEVKIIRESKNQ